MSGGDRVVILGGDCRAVLATLPARSFDSVVTDPPYDLLSASRNGSRRINNDPAKPFGRHAGGFMGMQWDATGVAFDPRTWKAVLRVLKPGGYMLAMGGTRTYHRLACAVEDAGFEIRDTILNLFDADPRVQQFLDTLTPEQRGVFLELYSPSPLRAWVQGQGFPKGKGNLKPAWEPILLVRKPGPRVLPLGIDECRVPTGGDAANARANKGRGLGYHGGDGERGGWSGSAGRYPANVAIDDSDEVAGAFAEFGERSGPRAPARRGAAGEGWGMGEGERVAFGDTGTAARFFYCSKASKSERGRGNHHPTVKPLALIRWLVRLVTPPGGRVLDPFAGSGTTGAACLAEGRYCTLIEKDEKYLSIIRSRIKQPAPGGPPVDWRTGEPLLVDFWPKT